jgi:hypothetical protein
MDRPRDLAELRSTARRDAKLVRKDPLVEMYADAVVKHEAFRQRVTDTVLEFNEQYGLGLCQDGLDEFAQELGIPRINPTEARDYTVRVSVLIPTGSESEFRTDLEDALLQAVEAMDVDGRNPEDVSIYVRD